MSFQQYNVYDGLTSCRVIATTNQSGTYFNGMTNNGVGATFTYATGVLTIDSVDIVAGDSVALAAQTNAWENGIYICTTTGIVGVSAVLQRRADFQSIEQIRAGQWCTISAGSVSAGTMLVVLEPLPLHLGLSGTSNYLVLTPIVPAGLGTASTKAASSAGAATVASVGSAVVINHMAKFIDTSGTIDDTAGTIINSGSLQAGLDAVAGNLISFPTTTASGRLILSALDAGGAFDTTIRNSAMGQSTVYSLGDIGAATGGVVVATSAIRMKSVAGAAAAGGAAAQSFTDAFCTSASNVVGNWNTQTNAASVQKIVPGNGTFVVTSDVDAGVGTFNYIITK